MVEKGQPSKHEAPEVSVEFEEFLRLHSPLGNLAIQEYFYRMFDSFEDGGSGWVINNEAEDPQHDNFRIDYYDGIQLMGFVRVDSQFNTLAYVIIDQTNNKYKNIYSSRSKRPGHNMMTALHRVEEYEMKELLQSA